MLLSSAHLLIIELLQPLLHACTHAKHCMRYLFRILMQVCLLTSDRPWSSRYSRMKGILRLVVRVSTCILSPGNCFAKPVPSVAKASQELHIMYRQSWPQTAGPEGQCAPSWRSWRAKDPSCSASRLEGIDGIFPSVYSDCKTCRLYT